MTLRKLFDIYYFDRTDREHQAVLNISDKQMFLMFKTPRNKKWEINFKKDNASYKLVMTKNKFDSSLNTTQSVWIDMYICGSTGKFRKIKTDHKFIKATMYFIMKNKNWLEVYKELKSGNQVS